MATSVKISKNDPDLKWGRHRYNDGSWVIRIYPQTGEQQERLDAIMGSDSDPSQRTIILDQKDLKSDL